MRFFHGSKISGLKILNPTEHVVADDNKVVFATDNKAYALAMIHGSGDELAVSMVDDQGQTRIYVDELEPGKLSLLNDRGYLYELVAETFEPSPEALVSEYISYKPVKVISETVINNIGKELEKLGVKLVGYENVLESMQTRGKSMNSSIEHSDDRFL